MNNYGIDKLIKFRGVNIKIGEKEKEIYNLMHGGKYPRFLAIGWDGVKDGSLLIKRDKPWESNMRRRINKKKRTDVILSQSTKRNKIYFQKKQEFIQLHLEEFQKHLGLSKRKWGHYKYCKENKAFADKVRIFVGFPRDQCATAIWNSLVGTYLKV